MSPARELLSLLRSSKARLAFAESCTGGGLADQVTGIAGASDVFWGSLVTYQESAKRSVLGIPSRTLTSRGAVSPEVARKMAESLYRRVRRAGRNTICVSTTGIAGPSGTPVGLCYIGISSSHSRGRARVVRVPPRPGSRGAQKKRFVRAALLEAIREARKL